MTEEPEGDGPELTCEECGAPLAPDAKFCDECGASVARSRREAGRSGRRSERAEKVGARATIAKARDKVSKIRMLFWVLAVLPAFLGGVGLLASGPSPIVLGFCAAALLLVAGALCVPRQPFVWTLVLAAVMTLLSAADLIFRGPSIGFAIEAFVSLALWASLPQMKSAAEVLAEHGDDFDSRHLTRRVKREGVDRSEARDRSRLRNQKEMGSKMRTTVVVGLLAVGVAVVFGVWLFAVGQTESLSARTALFEERWAADDVAGVEVMFENERRQTYWPKVARLFERYGWDEDLPELGEAKVLHEDSSSAEVHWKIRPKGIAKVRWVVVNSQWKIHRIGFAELR